MTQKDSEVYRVIHKDFRRHNNYGFRGSYYSYLGPHLTLKESEFLNHIYNTTELRPKLYYVESKGSYSPLRYLLVPKSFKYYKTVVTKKQNYNRLLSKLSSKGVLTITSNGLVLNHTLFPFDSRRMTYLKSLLKKPPLPPL